MGLLIDTHLHTKRYSPCSQIDPGRLVAQAVSAGLDGLVITEHHAQWPQEDLDALVNQSGHPGFILLAGFEYSSSQGDFLLYGVPDEAIEEFKPHLPAAEALEMARAYDAAIVAAHPTRGGLSTDPGIVLTLPLHAIEVASVNLQDHEQRLAMRLADAAELPPIAGSDAHALRDVGRYAADFTGPIRNRRDLQEALLRGTFSLPQ